MIIHTVEAIEKAEEVLARFGTRDASCIADELGINVDEVRNFFGGRHFEGATTTAGIVVEEGPDGGIVSFEDDAIYQAAMRILKELE